MSDEKLCRFQGHLEWKSEDEAHSVYAASFEAAAEAIARKEDENLDFIAPERNITLWPWGLQQMARTYVVDTKLVYSTRCRAPDEGNHPLKSEGSTSSGE